MNPAFVSLLSCPDCSSDLRLQGSTPAAQDVDDGILTCVNGHSYPVVRGIPRFVSSDGYAGNFGFEWNVHNKTQLDDSTSHESEEAFRTKTGFTPEDLKGKLVLDVGCGMGRFSDVASRWGATVVGIDLTSAVDAAYGNLKNRDNVYLAQADVFRLPFREKTFDYIFSIGVLHHTPDTKAAFDRLPVLLKPGGRIAIWVYSTLMRAWCRPSDLYRHVTTRMPKRMLYQLCYFAIPWYHVSRVPALGRVARGVLPTSGHPNPEWRVLDTFDWYSPKYQWKHSDSELQKWFEGHGLVSLTALSFPTSMQGMRPISSSASTRAAVEVPVGELPR
jgi:SAM-dependent methyltransferase